MKKIFKLLLPLSSSAIILPAVTMTGCAPVYQNNLKQVVFKDDTVSDSFSTCVDVNRSLDNLLCGDKSFHGGNYMLIIGSECSDSSNQFFSPNPRFEQVHSDYSKENAFVGSTFYTALELFEPLHKDVDFGIVLYLDTESLAIANQDKLRQNQELYRPFDYKWTDSDVTEAENQKINTKDNKVIVKDEYARNDDSAKSMRDLLSYLQTIYTAEVFTATSSTDLAYTIVWKEGVPQSDYFKSIDSTGALDYMTKVHDLWATPTPK